MDRHVEIEVLDTLKKAVRFEEVESEYALWFYDGDNNLIAIVKGSEWVPDILIDPIELTGAQIDLSYSNQVKAHNKEHWKLLGKRDKIVDKMVTAPSSELEVLRDEYKNLDREIDKHRLTAPRRRDT